MPKEEWGVKRICPSTGRRFYDLGKDPIVSPYTGEVVELDENTKTRVAAAKEKVETVAEDDLDMDDADLLVDDDDDASSDSDLGDDLLDDDDDDNVSLDEIADVATDDDDS